LVYLVPPFIRVGNPSIGVSNGSSVVLECDVEAFPEPLCYWERTDGRSIDSEHKAFLRDQGKYKVTFVFYVLLLWEQDLLIRRDPTNLYASLDVVSNIQSPFTAAQQDKMYKVGIILYFVFFF